MLVALEKKYGGLVKSVPRRKVSPLDPRPVESISNGGMVGGDRMSDDRHGYAKHYAKYLKNKIGTRVVLVEVGILKGTGLAVWSDVFSADSRIIGLDVDISHFADNRTNLENLGAFSKNNIDFYEFDQFVDGPEKIKDILRGEKIDIVIDDGCHFDDAIIKTLFAMWPHLAEDFVYIIEDNKRIAKHLKDNFLKAFKLDFPKASLHGYGELTVLKDDSLQEWCARHIGYLPDYENPKSFNEKIGWKKLNDRNPLLPVTADKYLSRKYIADKIGTDALLKLLYYVTDDPGSIPFDSLPENYVVKATHGSGWNIFVRGDADRKAIVRACHNWLNQRYAPYAREWCYDQIKPRIIVEEMIERTPDSYKLHVFGGECRMIQLSQGSIERKKSLTFTLYDMQWKKLAVRYVHDSGEPIPRPHFIDSLIKYSEAVGKDFDYVRVDWCVGRDGRICFEEVTHYPVSGHASIRPVEYDYTLGSYWNLTPQYWLKNGSL